MACTLLIAIARPARGQEGNARALRIAAASPFTRRAMAQLREQAKTIRDERLKKLVAEMLDRPSPTFYLDMDAAARERARAELVAAGLLDSRVTLDSLFPPLDAKAHSAQPFVSAPGSTQNGHHAFPGGLPQHTAVNTQAAIDLERNYHDHYGLVLDHDLVVAAPILHDAMKAWVLEWKSDGGLILQEHVANTGTHHVFIVAELLHRKFPAALVAAVAAAHSVPSSPDWIGYIRAGAILAHVDPVAAGLLSRNGDQYVPASLPSTEAGINHVADADFAVTEEWGRVSLALGQLATNARIPIARQHWMANRIRSRVPDAVLSQAFEREGVSGLKALLDKQGVPLASDEDR